MKQDRLNIQYQTLYKIVRQRYKGVTPESIKKEMIDSMFEFEFEVDVKKNDKSLETKKRDYIYSEVTRTLKILTKSKKSEEESEDYYPFDEDSNDEQYEDYKYYPHSLLIGVKELTKQGIERKRNVAYRLNKNIKFSISDYNELKLATNFLYLQFTNNDEALVDDDMVKHITKTQVKQFIVDTFIQITTHKDIIKNHSYSLHLLLTLIELKANINIKIKNNTSAYTLNNVLINELTFNTNSFEIKSNGLQISLSDITEIEHIESSSPNSIRENLKNAEDELMQCSPEFQKKFKNFVEKFLIPYDIFFQDT